MWVAGAIQDMQRPPGQPARRRPAAPSTRSTRWPQPQPDFPWADYDIEDQGDARRRRQLPRARRRHRPRRARARRRGQVRRRRRRGHRTPSGRTPRAVAGGAADPRHRTCKLSQLHRAARGLRRRRVRPRVRPRPRPARPLRHLRRRRLRHRLLGPDELRLALAARSSSRCRPTWASGTSGCSAGPTRWSSTPVTSRATVNVGQTSRTPEGHRGRRQDQPAATRSSPSPTPHSGANMWWSSTDQDWADDHAHPRRRRAGRRPTPSSGCGTTTSSRRTGTSASSRSRPTAAPPGPSRRSTTRPAPRSSTPDGYADPNGRMADFGNKKYGLTGDTDGWRARLRRPDAVRRDRPSSSGCATPPTRPSRSAAGSPTTSRSPTAAPTVWSDDVEAATTAGPPTVGTFTDTTGAGWRIDTGTSAERAVLPGRVAQLRRLRQGPAVRLRRPTYSRRRRVEGREDQVQRARHARLVPRHDATATSTTS